MVKNNKKDLQTLMEEIFPMIKKYPINSMTTTLGYNKKDVIVSMLIIADDFMISDFINTKNDKSRIDITVYTERNKNGIGEDIIIRLDFYYETGHPVFDTTILGELGNRQKDFIEALKKVDKLMVWIANKDRKMVRIEEIKWNYNDFSRMFEPLLQ